MPTDPLAQARREGIAEGLEMAAKVVEKMADDAAVVADLMSNQPDTVAAAARGQLVAASCIFFAIRALKDGGSDATRCLPPKRQTS